ncbi:MAG: hypothetical protein NVSMB9_30330 [Isosphaeraceae bacterium]
MNSRWLYQRGRTLRLLGRNDEADGELARAEKIKKTLEEISNLEGRAAQDPADPEVRCRLGQLCSGLGSPALAANWYRAALACDPAHAGARAGLSALEKR